MSVPLRLERVLTQEDFDAFAALSGDDNPIHVDPAFSAATKFGRTVAHGVFLISVLSGLIVRANPGARVVAQAIRFPAPTFTGEPVLFEATPAGEGAYDCRVTRLKDGATTCDGRLEVKA